MAIRWTSGGIKVLGETALISGSIGAVVRNVIEQVARAFIPAISKKFSKISVELGEVQAVKVKPGTVNIAEKVGAVARDTEGETGI